MKNMSKQNNIGNSNLNWGGNFGLLPVANTIFTSDLNSEGLRSVLRI